MTTSTSFLPASELVSAESAQAVLPRGCTFTESDWRALAPFWYPVAFSHEVGSQPYAATLLDERVVVYRLSDGKLAAARDICQHRGVPLSMGHVEGDEIICKYHGLRYDREGRCTCIPAHPGGAISPRLRLQMFQVQERYGLVWVRLVDNGPLALPEMNEWDDPAYLTVLPNSVPIKAAAGRQIEGFLDVSHFAFIHTESFGEADNTVVPDYPITKTPAGFVADYISTVSNYSHGYKHLNPPDFLWRRRFEVYYPFTAKLTVFFPNDGQLHIMNAASPVSARQTQLFVPICRNFDKDAPLQATLDFNHQVFAEDIAIVERQWPEDLPIDLQEEAHFPADRSSIAYRKGLAALGLGRSYTA
ncbi:aromatic ring-hydroxylating oxygenase subunit alpha [Granulicella mallensis]|uniref:Rieske (2Fe-2S) iron-sulfur domain protein n=1 Tax=Granulicella mallensis (strain ATCC BAA-1857 / DSM 23137 / MP5ACTX8) TaxID=682795 RepID=G8NWU0_GRAMM|nr:aromatic ring-hydroxylating dioxygenase subunit alpha [Granulicella mallensis]AEU34378.1 Rieske (2Fe-2S) iron-sulfur domain protein [Granulicella mallensis MP5ACTX8]